MSDIFLSSARSSATQAQAVAEALRALGYSVWRDDELPAHRAYGDVIAEQLSAAKAVVVIWSADAIKSEWVRSEANHGREARKLVQLTVDNAPLPMPFEQIQCADLQGWTGDTSAPGWRKVAKSVADLMAAAALPTTTQLPATLDANTNSIATTDAATTTHATSSAPTTATTTTSALERAPASETSSTAPSKRWRRIALAVASAVAVASLAGYLLWPQALDRWRTSSPTSASGRAAATHNDVVGIPDFAGRPAIAVLPLENLSADPSQAFMADGLADELIARLSSWRTIPVIARSSSFRYRGNNVDVKRVATDLGVRYVVEGSVRRAGDRIRITVQLVDATSGANVWSETYDRKVGDLFALQDEISTKIAASLMGDLTRVEGARAQQRGTQNLDAWSLCSLGVQRLDKASYDLRAAKVLFEKAIARDPNFATAHALLAMTLGYIAGNTLPPGPEYQRNIIAALNIARRAVDLDPRDSLAYYALGDAYSNVGNLQNALNSYRRAVELNPSSSLALRTYGYAKLLAGDPQADIVAAEQSIRMDPQGNQVPFAEKDIARANWEIGRYQPGIEAARRAVSGQPGYYLPYIMLAMNAVALGRMDEARAAIARARHVQPLVSLAYVQRNETIVPRPDIDARRNAALRQAGLQ